VAGKKAIMETAVSRFVLPLPVLFFPAFANAILEKMRLWPKGVAAGKFMELGLCICSLTFALPMSIALFEQRAMIKREDIDENLANLKVSDFPDPNSTKPKIEGEEGDKLVDRFYFNKGL
jgi:sideroflexin-5